MTPIYRCPSRRWLVCCAVFLFPFSIFQFLFSNFASAQQEIELRSKARLFGNLGPGVTALKRDAAGRYFVLASVPDGLGSVVYIFDATGKRLGQIPTMPAILDSRQPAPLIQYADDFDLDASGRIYVADRGSNAIKIFSPDGALERSVAVTAPASVVALTDGEFVVTSMRPEKLVQIYDAKGKLAREFGELVEIAARADLNRFLNIGRLATDPDHHIYRAFTNLPEPTLRKYDRFGYALAEIELAAIDFLPTARAARREIQRQDERGGTPALKPTIRAVGVDPQSQHVWLGVGGLLVHCSADGTRLATYRIFTAEGVRIEAVAILVEPDRLLVAADPIGIFELPRPDKPSSPR